jgi:hypothetical protein
VAAVAAAVAAAAAAAVAANKQTSPEYRKRLDCFPYACLTHLSLSFSAFTSFNASRFIHSFLPSLYSSIFMYWPSARGKFKLVLSVAQEKQDRVVSRHMLKYARCDGEKEIQSQR